MLLLWFSQWRNKAARFETLLIRDTHSLDSSSRTPQRLGLPSLLPCCLAGLGRHLLHTRYYSNDTLSALSFFYLPPNYLPFSTPLYYALVGSCASPPLPPPPIPSPFPALPSRPSGTLGHHGETCSLGHQVLRLWLLVTR